MAVRSEAEHYTADGALIQRAVIHIVLPIGFGSLIYVLWRKPTLRVFDWLGVVGLQSTAVQLRHWSVPVAGAIPAWFVFSLPAALWMYAMVAWFQLTWGRSSSSYRWMWLFIALSLGIGSELGQFVHLLPGTYDNKDVAFYLAAWLVAIACTSERKISC